MSGVAIVQSSSTNYVTSGLIDVITWPFTLPNTAGNIGLAWITSDDAGGLSVSNPVTDSQGNIWEEFPGIQLNTQFSLIYICPTLKTGVNVVKVSGCIPSGTGAPNLVLMEIQPPPCPIGSTAIHGFVGTVDNTQVSPQLNLFTNYNLNQGPFYHSLFVALYNNSDGFTATTRTWSAALDSEAIAGNLITQFVQATGHNTGAISFCVVPYPFSGNNSGFNYSPSTPLLNPAENLVIGVLISTQM
jgi:hypothetical protein